MQHQGVAVRVPELGHEADAAVDDVAEELDPLRFELGARRLDVLDLERDRHLVLLEIDPEPLADPPYYLIEVIPAITNTWGGLRIDTQTRVLDVDGAPICGLLALSCGYQLPKQRGFSPEKGTIQDGRDAVITPATPRSFHPGAMLLRSHLIW